MAATTTTTSTATMGEDVLGSVRDHTAAREGSMWVCRVVPIITNEWAHLSSGGSGGVAVSGKGDVIKSTAAGVYLALDNNAIRGVSHVIFHRRVINKLNSTTSDWENVPLTLEEVTGQYHLYKTELYFKCTLVPKAGPVIVHKHHVYEGVFCAIANNTAHWLQLHVNHNITIEEDILDQGADVLSKRCTKFEPPTIPWSLWRHNIEE
ncbi:hypothetical protein Pelo_7250 [Pelomyxa schiedti]|nr:hypothetical protein Pelo_7250 [Pelomyxa schiedti]